MAMAIPPRTPVLVGVGVMMQREEDFARALEPIDLMFEVVRAAGKDCGAPALLPHVDTIAVPRGRWRYRNPAGEIARLIGAPHATTILASVGVLQQTLVADACERIADGRADAALVVGADAGFRLLRARLAGERASERDQSDEPDIRLEPKDELRHPAEAAVGLKMPVGLYAVLESARRARQGLSVDAHRNQLATRYARFAEIASTNPHSWTRTPLDGPAIRDPGPRNPMQNVIAALPGVREVAVVGQPDPEYGEKLRAFVVATRGATIDPTAIIAGCRDRLAGFKVPRIVSVIDQLPRNAGGKVLKTELRGRAAG